jgi:hypothetical protein
MGWYGLDLSGLGQWPLEGFCEHGNEPLGSIKYCEILELLSDCWLPKNNSAPCSHFTCCLNMGLLKHISSPLFITHMITPYWIALHSSDSLLTARSVYKSFRNPLKTMKMAAAMSVRTFKNLQHSTQHVPRSRSHALSFSCRNLRALSLKVDLVSWASHSL